MVDRFKWIKMVVGTVGVISILFFTVIGVQTIWTDYVVKDYNKHLTEQVYVDATVDQNVNLVFYRKACPYCTVGKKALVNAAEKNSYPTFYIDVESETGQRLVKQYHIEKAATLITIREGESKLYLYAAKDKTGEIKADEKSIKEALNDTKN